MLLPGLAFHVQKEESGATFHCSCAGKLRAVSLTARHSVFHCIFHHLLGKMVVHFSSMAFSWTLWTFSVHEPRLLLVFYFWRGIYLIIASVLRRDGGTRGPSRLPVYLCVFRAGLLFSCLRFFFLKPLFHSVILFFCWKESQICLPD